MMIRKIGKKKKKETVQKSNKTKNENRKEDKEEDTKVSNISKLQKITLIDVTPLSLGIAVGKDDKMSKIIPKNTPIPVKNKSLYNFIW